MPSLVAERPEFQLEQDVLAWADDVYREAEADLMATPESKQIQRCIDFIEGKQWNARMKSRSRPVVNRVVRQFIEMASLLTDIQPDIKVHFNDQIDNYSEIQNLMNRMLEDWAHVSDFDMELLQVVMYGLLSYGPVKLQWNPFLRNGMGDSEFQPFSPLDFMQIGASSNIQTQAEVCIMRKVVVKPWLIRRFGDVAREVRPDAEFESAVTPQRPANFSSQRWQKLNPLMRNLHSKLANTGSAAAVSRFPKCIMKEFWFRDDSIWEGSESILVGKENTCWSYWVEPGMPLYPRGRTLTIAGGRVLEDAPNPYWHSLFPFELYRPLRVPWKFEGLSALDPIAAIQSILNRIDGGIVDAVLSSVDPPFMAPMAAFSEQDKDSLDPNAPGTKIFYRNNAPREPSFRKPIEIGSYVLPTADRMEREMAMSSGSAAMNQAMQKKQIPGEGSLDMIMSSRAVNIRLFAMSEKSFLERCGAQIVANKLQFETADNRVRQYGWKGLTDSDFAPYYKHLAPKGMQPEEFVRNMALTIRRGSLLEFERNDELQNMASLRKAGEIDHTTFLEFLNQKFNANLNIELIQQRLQKEAQQKAMLAAAAGQAAHAQKKH